MRTASAQCLVCSAENPPGAKVCSTCGAALGGDPAAGYGSALPTGTRLKGGAYSVGKVLGQGGFGITYLGGDARLRRPVAIKEFFPYGSLRRGLDVQQGGGMSAADFATTRTKFGEEARILSRFNHDGIVEVYDTFEENGTAYMVMEFLRGRSLGKLIDEEGPQPERRAVDYVTRAGEALEVVHRADLLHRDVKPDNVMLTDDGRVVLIDFGNARTFAAGKTRRMTTMVTPGYAPLEQYGEAVRFGAFTDVYALAATLYHVLTGVQPAPATDRATGVDLESPRELDPRISTATSDAVMWALEMRIDRRPQSVRAFLSALRTGQAKEGGMGRRGEGEKGRPEARRPSPHPPIPHSPHPSRRPTPQPPSPPAPQPAVSGEGPYEVRVAGDSLQWPNRCACCLEEADSYLLAQYTGFGGPLSLFQETRGWEVPYCTTCLQHLQISESPSGGGGIGPAVAGSLAGLVLGGPVGMLLGLGAGAAASALGSAQRQAELQTILRPTCVAMGAAVAYDGWSGDVNVFRFLNRGFAEQFSRLNAANLVR